MDHKSILLYRAGTRHLAFIQHDDHSYLLGQVEKVQKPAQGLFSIEVESHESHEGSETQVA